MESGLVRLKEMRGVLLFQLPPHFARDLERLDRFLGIVPSHQRVSVEFRHPTWEVEETFAILERHGAAYCVKSGANLACVLRATANFVYIRLHGPDQRHLYAGSYSEADLRWWAGRIGEWRSQGRDVLAYFNNDGHGHAVRNALRLKEAHGGVKRTTVSRRWSCAGDRRGLRWIAGRSGVIVRWNTSSRDLLTLG